MKLHIPLRLRYALLALFGLSAFSAQADVVLNDYNSDMVTDSDIRYNGDCDLSKGWGGHSGLVWFANQARESTLTGNGVLSHISLQMLSEDGSQTSFKIDSGVTLQDAALVAFGNTHVKMLGEIIKGDNEIETGLYVCEGGILDVSQAAIDDGMKLSLMIEQGGTISGGNFTLNSHRRFEIVSPFEAGGQTCTNTFDGNLTLDEGARIEYSAFNDNGVVVPFSALNITGSLTISGAATLSFLLDNADEYYVPADNTVLITCTTLSGDLSRLTLEKGIWGDDLYDPSYSKIDDKVVKSIATADGYALYLAAEGSGNPDIPDIPDVPDVPDTPDVPDVPDLPPGSDLETVCLNDYSYGVNAAPVRVTDVNLLLRAGLPRLWDDEAGYDMGMELHWIAANGGELTLQLAEGTSGATMEGAGVWLENEAAKQAEWSGTPAQFTIGKGVGLQDCDIYAMAGTLLIVEGANAGTKDDYTMFSVQGGGAIELTRADMSGAAGVLLEFGNGTIKGNYRVSAETATKGARELYVGDDMYYGGRSVSATLDGNLTIAQGGKVEFAFRDKNDGSNELTCTPLAVTGTLTIEGAAEVGAYAWLDSPWVLGEQTVLFTCDTLQGEASSLSLTRFSLEDTELDPDGEDVYVPFEGYTIKSMSYGSGYALYIAAVGGDNPPPTPPIDPEPPVEPEVEIITSGTVTTPLSGSQVVQLSPGGTVDVSSLESLPQQYIAGTGGTLETAADQTLALSGVQLVGYSIAAATGEQSGAGLVVGHNGGKITDATIEFNGARYDTNSLQVQSGLAEISSNTTLGNGTGASTIEIGTGTGSGVGASVNNFGRLEADVTINARGSMDNRKSIVGDVALNNGGVLINSGGSITGDVSVANDALFRNDGVMDGILTIHDGAEAQGCGTYDAVMIENGGRMHVGNSPGRSSVKTLTLNSGSILSFTVDGAKPGNGAGYHSQMKVTDTLTFNGVARAEVEVTRGILSCGLDTFTLTLLDVSDATVTDNSGAASPVLVTIIKGAELLEDGYTFTWDAADASLTLTGKVDAKAAATVLDEDGSIIANTLWSSTSMVRSFARSATSQLGAPVGDKADGVSMWVAGLGDFISMDGFTSNAGGGALGAEAIITSNWRLGVALGVMSGTFTPDRGMGEVEQDGSMVGLYSEYVEDLGADADFKFSVYAAYGEVENDAKTFVAGSHELPGEATWNDDVFSVGTRLTWEFRVGEQTTLAPFIGLEYLSGTQESFTERFVGGEREYYDGSMYAVSLPVGITARTCVDLGDGQRLLPEMTVAYVGDISRKDPEVRSRVFGVENQHEGTSPGRSAFMMNAGGHWVMSESWSVGAFYNLEARSKEVSQEATMFIRCSF